MERVLSREAVAESQIGAEKVKIGLAGLSPSAGVTFMTLCLARFIANGRSQEVTVAEVGGRGIYDAMALDKRFADRGYFSFHSAVLNGKSIRGKRNCDEGINWAACQPEDEVVSMDLGHKMRLINNLSGDIVLCDFSGSDGAEGFHLSIAREGTGEKPNRSALDANVERGGTQAKGDSFQKAITKETYIKSQKRLFEDMDHIIFVIDPMPSKMLVNFENLNRVKAVQCSVPVTFLINKYNRGVNLKELYDFLKIKNSINVPYVGCEARYSAEYNCRSPYSQREVRNLLGEVMQKIYAVVSCG